MVQMKTFISGVREGMPHQNSDFIGAASTREKGASYIEEVIRIMENG